MTDLTILDSAADSVGRAGEAALDTVVGGAALAIDTVTRPRRSTGRARRRGSDVNTALIDGTEEVIDEVLALPERVLVAYLRLLRSTGRRDDVVGAATRAMLEAMHVPAKEAARFFERVERETALAKPGTARRGTSKRGRGKPATGVRRTATAARRTTTRTTRAARGTGTRRRRSA
jgi:hypothetical protein